MTVMQNLARGNKRLQLRPLSTGAWRPDRFAAADAATGNAIRPIGRADVHPLVPGLDLWDCWPLAHPDGRTAEVSGRQFWFFLSSAQFADPVERHGHARIRLLSRGADGWRDHGNALPDQLNPGSREWAGSAVLESDGRVTLYYTVAGQRGETVLTVEQRLFVLEGCLTADGVGNWAAPVELVRPDERRYVRPAGVDGGAPGSIKAFRDPFFFHDPVTGLDHIVFTASAGWSDDPYNGLVGLATRTTAGWELSDPLVDAVGVNNELERAQAHYRGGLYYLLWSTQSHTFSPAGPTGPNGLYGMVGETLHGPWRPVNDSGLIAANPADEPGQSYSWVVTGEDEVWSFIDYWGMAGRHAADHPELLRGQFGGTAAPVFRLAFDGDRVIVR